MCPSAAFEAEVLRINGRYNAEIVEALSVCPYAAPARRTGGSVRRVWAAATVTEEDLLGIARELAENGEIEVAQVIFPRVSLSAREMLDLGQRFGEQNAKGGAHAGALSGSGSGSRRGGDHRPIFVHAVFHPELPYKVDTPAQLVPFFRRSPDPFLQLVRLAVLDELHQKRPRGTQFFDGSAGELAKLLAEKPVKSITELITEDNHRAAQGGGLARIETILLDILEDRDRSYGPLLAAGEICPTRSPRRLTS